MNLVRIFVNAAWWNSNVQVPIANQPYQTYIDGLIQRAKKYGNYVLILKAGQFPDAPCGASGTNCPAPNQGDLNCAANASRLRGAIHHRRQHRHGVHILGGIRQASTPPIPRSSTTRGKT